MADAPDVPLWMQRLATDLDDVAKDDQGPFDSRPVSRPGTPGKAGRYYFATDRKLLYRDSGGGWNLVSSWKRRAEGALTDMRYASITWGAWGTASPQPSVTVPFTGTYDVTIGARVVWHSPPVGNRVTLYSNATGLFQALVFRDVSISSSGRLRDVLYAPQRLTLTQGQIVQLSASLYNGVPKPPGTDEGIDLLDAFVQIEPVEDA